MKQFSSLPTPQDASSYSLNWPSKTRSRRRRSSSPLTSRNWTRRLSWTSCRRPWSESTITRFTWGWIRASAQWSCKVSCRRTASSTSPSTFQSRTTLLSGRLRKRSSTSACSKRSHGRPWAPSNAWSKKSRASQSNSSCSRRLRRKGIWHPVQIKGSLSDRQELAALSLIWRLECRVHRPSAIPLTISKSKVEPLQRTKIRNISMKNKLPLYSIADS